MKLEDLADFTAAQLEALSDKQLEEILKPHFPNTRPEMVVKKEKQSNEPQLYLSPQKKAALAALEADGLDISFMKRKFKK